MIAISIILMKRGLHKFKNIRQYLRIIFTLVLIVFLFISNIPLYLVILMGIILIFLVLLKDRLYTKIDQYLTDNFHFISNRNKLVKRSIIILSFILVYIIIKQLIFLLLRQAGLDVPKIIANSLNYSII